MWDMDTTMRCTRCDAKSGASLHLCQMTPRSLSGWDRHAISLTIPIEPKVDAITISLPRTRARRTQISHLVSRSRSCRHRRLNSIISVSPPTLARPSQPQQSKPPCNSDKLSPRFDSQTIDSTKYSSSATRSGSNRNRAPGNITNFVPVSSPSFDFSTSATSYTSISISYPRIYSVFDNNHIIEPDKTITIWTEDNRRAGIMNVVI
ncbi:hypothetical protein HD553DRAFT_324318 [Filobasidium floriforme]|uniref:uncharacterized protein n=1 Tax=Filobasidium floriforme TaxID=5210 RepID=UPI001E8CE23B|nr:uncharacterized protein HD553DRAFT_324318 [Filobasidium floriforme]KAH8084201.1 hypothetical protein HD553DRAFT_324318 [Filobasidium floriforme]